jgi:hypothetical protein
MAGAVFEKPGQLASQQPLPQGVALGDRVPTQGNRT